MAVDYFHRLIVSGPLRQLDALRRAVVRTLSRRVAGRTWSERLPFSIEALYDIDPGARRVERELPGEAYDIRAWPIARETGRRAELRYQLHTRDFELKGFVRSLSRVFPALTFRLSTHCLDGDDIESFSVSRGKVRRWRLPQLRRRWHWDRARQQFHLAGEAVYEDDKAELFAEDGMRDESLDHWVRTSRRRGRTRPRQWWNRPVARDFMEHRELDLIAYNELLQADEKAAAAAKNARRRRKRSRQAR